MHPKVSNAEIDVFKALSAANLTTGMITQKTIILKSTIPDFCWYSKKKIVFLDGIPVHEKEKQQKHDQEIDDLLERKGWSVLRIPYDPPLTESSLAKIVEQIKQFVYLDGE